MGDARAVGSELPQTVAQFVFAVSGLFMKEPRGLANSPKVMARIARELDHEKRVGQYLSRDDGGLYWDYIRILAEQWLHRALGHAGTMEKKMDNTLLWFRVKGYFTPH